MGKPTRLHNAQVLALASLCALRMVAPGLVFAQEASAPTEPVAPSGSEATAPAVPPATQAPPVEPASTDESNTAQSQAIPAPSNTAVSDTTSSTDTANPPALETPNAAAPSPTYIEPVTPAPYVAEPIEAPAVDQARVSDTKSNLPSYLMWAVGGASLVTGTVFGITALTAKSDFNNMPTYAGADRVNSLTTSADIAFGLSAVLLITGTVFYFMPDAATKQPTASSSKRATTARLHVAPLLGRTTGGALSLQF